MIDAINKNQPFDRFTIEQIAGDMLPNATQEQILATAFHRNTLTNDEGGTSDEEFRCVAVVDRVNTTMQVWMGLTAACAQCHDHKYDAISQEEYFRMYAIFNQTEDSDKSDNSPNLIVITPAEAKQQSRVEKQDRFAGNGHAQGESATRRGPGKMGSRQEGDRQGAGGDQEDSCPRRQETQ